MRAVVLRCCCLGALLVEAGQFSLASPIKAVPGVAASLSAEEELLRDRAAFRARQFDVALKHLKAAGAKDSNLPPARVVLARMFLVSNQRSQGRQVLKQAVAEALPHPDVWLTFAVGSSGCLRNHRLIFAWRIVASPPA
jgi:predicted Zn-dependent protease